MKRKSVFGLVFGFGFAALAALGIFASCEVGLGSAVDVESPVLEIKTPPTSAVIRDKFAIAGTWEDDGSIKDVTISLRNTATKKTLPALTGEFNQEPDTKEFKGDWSVIIDPAESNLPDGSYEATITMQDNGHHKTVITRSFVVDNTPPVVVLQRPSTSAKDENAAPDLFGQTLSLTGQAADDNNIKKIRVNIYSDPDCKNLIHFVDLFNVPPTISLDVAKFKENIENDYSKIYGSKTKDGKKPPVYCTIVAYDDAQRYPVISTEAKDDDELGNSTNTYYLYDEIYSDVLSEFKVTELYSIMNNSFTSDNKSRAATATSIPDILKPFEIKTGKFQLNPANNPEYKVVGREGLEKDENGKLLAYNFANPANDLTNESNITVKVDVGLDAIPLDVKSMRVYLLPFDSEGNPVEDKPENRIYPTPSDPPYEKNGTGYTFTTKIIKDACKDKNGNDVLLTIGNPYLIAIEGTDSMKNEAVAEEGKVFGFRLAPNGAAPILDVNTSINSAAFVGDSMVYVPRYNPADATKITNLKFEGTVTVEDGEPTVEYSLDGKTRQKLQVTSTGNKGEFSFGTQITVDDFVFENSTEEAKLKSGQHNIVFYANQTQEAAPVKKTLMYQVDGPKVTLTSVEPTAYNYYYGQNDALVEDGKAETEIVNGKESKKKYLNGKNVKLNVTIIAGAVGLDKSDEKKPVIEFLQNGVCKLKIDSPTFDTTDFIDTTLFDDDPTKPLTIRITSYDLAGNKGIFEDTYYVKQSTDIPVILPKNSANSTLSMDMNGAQSLTNTTINVYSANQTVAYKLIDDDGLYSATYTIVNANTDVINKTETITSLGNSQDYQLEVTMPDTPGTYKVTIMTKDINTEGTTGSAVKSKAVEFFIRVTAAAPTIDEIILEQTIYNGSQSVEPKVVIKSDQVPFKLQRTVTNASGTAIAAYGHEYTKDETNTSVNVADLETASPTINDSFAISPAITASGKYTIEYKVTDKNDKYGQASKTITVDLTAPKITGVNLASNAYSSSKWYNSKTLSLDVTAADIEGETGISAVEYSTNGTVWTALSYNSTSKKYSGSAVFDTEGSLNALYIRAVDKAGNTTYYNGSAANGVQSETPVSVNVKIDTSAPVLTIDKYQVQGLSEKDIDASKIYIKAGKTLSIKGTYKDEQSGVPDNSLTFTFGNLGAPTITYGTGGSWTAEFSNIKNTSTLGALTVTGHNGAGVESTVSPFEVVLDTTNPVISNIQIKSSQVNGSLVYKKSETEYFVNNTAETPTFTIQGIATDDKGVDKVQIKYSDESAWRNSDNGKSDFVFADTNSNKPWKNRTTSSSVSFQIKAIDIAGNEETSDTIKVWFDTTGPLATHENDSSGKDKYFRIGEQNRDDGIQKDSDGNPEIDPSTGKPKNTDGQPKWNSALDENVGGKYKADTFGNKTTITIRGLIEDGTHGSGVDLIYYKLYHKLSDFSSKTDSALISDVIAANLYFSPLEAAETKRVYYNSGAAHDDSIKSTYKTTIPGFAEGQNYLVIVTKDKVGNKSIDKPLDAAGQAVRYYSLNVDTTAPEITETYEDNKIRYSKGGEYKLEVTVKDPKTKDTEGNEIDNSASGIKTVIFSTKNGKVPASLKNGSTDIYTADIQSILDNNKSVTVNASASDVAGSSSNIIVADVFVDTKGPDITITSPSAGDSRGTSITFTGSVSDGGAGVITSEGPTLYYRKSQSEDWSTYTEKANLNSNGKDWTCTFTADDTLAPSGADTTLYFRVSAKDKAGTGNVGYSEPITVIVDRKVPAVSSIMVDERASSELGSSTTKWFKNQTVNLNGTFEDSASGVNKVWYQVKKGTAAYSSATSVASDGTFSINISDLVSGQNQIKVWAEDKYGNQNNATECYVKVDVEAPEIGYLAANEYTNASTDLTFDFTVEDNASGLKTPEVKIGTVSAAVEAKSGVANTYTATLAKASIPGAAGTTSSFAINVTAKDNAENTNTTKIGNLIVDRKAPTLNIANITDADTTTTAVVDVNGTITISGTASDDDTLSSVAVAYKLKSAADSAANWKTTALSNQTGTNTWSAKLATTSLTDNTEYTIRAVATDAAGNKTTKTTNVKVNQDSDRPLITLMQIEKNNATTLLSKDIMGSITDDDGTDGLMLWYANGSKPTAPSYSNNTWTATGWTPITLNGTSWTYSYTGDDGQFNWYFAVGDAQHGVFVTDGTKKPYIKYYNQTSKEDNTDAAQFKIDTVAPQITSIKMLRKANTTVPTASDTNWTATTSNLKFGGSNKYLFVMIAVTEPTAMHATTPITSSYLGSITVETNCSVAQSGTTYTYIAGPFNLGSKETGTPALDFIVTDASGKTDSDSSKTIKVDNAAPAVEISNPEDKDSATAGIQVNGKNTQISGTIADANNVSEITLTANANSKTVTFKYPAPSTTSATQKALTYTAGTGIWSASLDTTYLFNATGSKDLTLSVTAKDDFGNEKTINYTAPTGGLKINQDTDRPVIQMSQITANNAAVYLPSKTVFGSIADDDGIINKLWLWSTKLNGGAAPSSAPALSNTGTGPTGWISIGNADNSSLANNNWQIESTETDGSTTWYWAVADADNTIFWSKAGITASDTTGTVLSQPYVKYSGSDTKNTENAGITFKYDTESPEINSIKLIRLPTPAADDTLYTASQIEAQMGSLGVNWSDDSNIPFGADKGLMYMQVIVKERTAMPTDTSKNLLKIRLNSSDEDFLTVTRTGEDANIHDATTDADTAGPDPKYTYILGPFNMTKNAVNGLPAISTTSGIKTLKLVAYDDAGRSTSREKVITVDNDANIKITGVSPKPTAETSGEFTLRGSVEDAESSISAMYYHIPSTTVYNNWRTAANATAKTAVLADVEDAGSQDATNGWKLIDNSNGAISWRIDFTTLNRMIGYSTEGGNDATVDEKFSGYDITTNPSEPQFVYNLPIWIKVIDEVGNVGYVTRTSATTTPPEEAADIKVKYNPNADRPTVEIIDPEIDPNGIARGGTIKISGAASDNEGISGVYLQFDLDGDGTYGNEIDDDTIFRTPGQGETIEKPFTAQDIVQIPYTNLTGIKASGTRNWNYKFNITGIKNYANTSKKIKVRAIAIDSDSSNPYVSAWSRELIIQVNNDIPSFEDLYVVQRNGTSYNGTELVRREYERNMFIKYEEGKTWFLEGKVKTTSNYLKRINPEEYAVDASGNKTSTLKSYEWTGTGSTLTADTNNPSSPAGNAAYEDDGKTISFQIPISSGGDWHSSIYAKDDKANDNEGEATAYYEVKIDNVAPTFPDIYTAGEASDTYQSIRLYRDAYGESLNRLDNGKAKLQNSNGSRFTLSGKIEEKGSGFDKAVFYIKRIGNDNKPRVYNIMESHGKNNDANRTDILPSGTSVTSEKPIYINSDNLPVRPVTVTKVGTIGDVFSAAEIETNMNIRTGGLVYIGGLYRTITAVDRNAKTVTIYPTYQGSETSALFVYGMVVDSTGENEAADGTIYESDNDGLLESYSGNQNIDYRWDATFNSANIPDGPIEIHVVTFDKAGNIGHGYMKTRAENNAPRITKVMLGTDLNGNDKFDYGSGEFKTFYLMLDEYNNPVTKTGTAGWNLDTSKSMGGTDVYWKVKKDIAVIPEFVGGAGPFYYNFSKGDSGIKEAAKLRTSATDATDISGKQLKASGANDKIQHKKTDGTYENADWGYSRADNVGGSLTMTSAELTAADLGTNVEDDPTFYCFSFWDSTEDSTAGFDTGSCVLNIKLAQDLVDNNAPSAAVNPFEWKNASGYIKTTSVSVDNKTPTVTPASIEVLGDDDVLGTVSSTTIKIDSVTEVSTTTVTTTTITPNNSLYGASTANGHIELESDLVDSLKNARFNNKALGDDPKVSGKITFHGTAYDDTRLSSIWFRFAQGGFTANHPKTGGDSSATNKPANHVQAAWYNTSSATWENATATMVTDGWEIVVTDKSFDQEGHTVDWYLSIDTSKITGVANLDRLLSVVSMDAAGGASTASTYQMDVVPYITNVTTRLARKNTPDPTVYSRTALGHYPIASNEAATTGQEVVLSGFNLAANNANVSLNNATISELSSGLYNYPVNGINSINNINNNDAHGSYDINATGLAEKTKVQNMYNRQPNLTTNLNLTDDVYFDVWEFNNRAAISKGALKDPMMRINPANNMIGFGFVNDIDSVSFPTNALSYTVMQKNNKDYVGTNFVYDSNGHAHTISIGLDAQGHTGIAGRMNYINSRWVTGSANGKTQWSTNFAIALESIGIPAGVSVKGHIIPYTEDSSLGLIDIERFPNPAITVANHTTDDTAVPTVYIMYYDADHDQIRFRYGEVNNTGANRSGTQYGLLNDSKCEYYIHSSVNNGEQNQNNKSPTANRPANRLIPNADTTGWNPYSGNDYDNHGMFEASKDYYALVAGNYYKQRNDGKTGNVTEGANPIITTGNKGSKYYAMDVYAGAAIGNDKVVMIWYDDTANKLMYMYRENLTAAGDNTDASVDGVTGKWSKPKAIFNTRLQDCAIKADPLGGIHITTYDQTNANLLYAYLPTYNHLETTGNTPYTCVIDAYSQVGKNMMIDTVLDSSGTKVIPYISYFTEGMSFLPKLAYIPGGIDKTNDATIKASIKDGSDPITNLFTGNWEVVLLPSDSALQQYKICVGAFRDTNNKTTTPTVTGTTSTSVTNGTVYPNNHTNLVVGYSIRENGVSYMETAMRKGVPDTEQH